MAVIGMGWAGTRQVEAAAELGRDVEIVAIVDSDPDHLADRSAVLGVAKTYPTLATALEDPQVEAVSICTPHTLHMDQAIAAAQAGRHVLVEKPMALSVADATRMIEAADGAGVVLFVAESECYMPFAVRLREVVRSRDPIGEVTFATMLSGYRQPDPRYPGRRGWLTEPRAGGTGTWFLQGIHAVAALRYVLGEVATVHVREHRTSSFRRPDLEATMAAFIVLENGLAVHFVHTTETNIPTRFNGFQLYGEGGLVIGGRYGGYDQYLTPGDPQAPQAPPTHHDYPNPGLSEYALELAAFARAVRGIDPGPTDGRSERRSLAVVEAGIESARTGHPVDLTIRFPELLT
jgi:UDP-N-acetyl-2-amino-2-deoxyglucuronate dehydrogenase